MSLYGYSDALSQGTAFNARVKNFNEGVLIHNEQARQKYKDDLAQKKNDIASDKEKEEIDDAKHGFTDGSGFIGTGINLVNAGASIRENGFRGYVSKELSERAGTIKNTARAIVYGEPKPTSTPITSEINQEVNAEGRVADGVVDAERAGKAVAQAGEAAGDAGKVITQATERESSGIVSGLVKKGLKIATQGKVADAGLSAISEIGGKAIGDYSGIVDVGKSIKNLLENKSVFSGESTADKFQEAGAVADVVGAVFPPLELVGGALNLTGGILDTIDDVKSDMDKKDDDTKRQIDPPKQTAVKVSPAFQSMGLVASQLPSAKTQITGTGSF